MKLEEFNISAKKLPGVMKYDNIPIEVCFEQFL